MIIKRQILYFHYIICSEEKSLIKKVFLAQKKCPSKYDWVQSLEKSLKILDLNEIEISKMTESRLGKILDEKIKGLQFKELLEEKKNKKKMDGLEYKELKMAPYMRPNFHLSEIDLKILFFKWRTNMLDVRENFKGTEVKHCRLLCGSLETQEHLFLCTKIGATQVNIQDLNCVNLKACRKTLNTLKDNINKRNILFRKCKTKIFNQNKKKKIIVKKKIEKYRILKHKIRDNTKK